MLRPSSPSLATQIFKAFLPVPQSPLFPIHRVRDMGGLLSRAKKDDAGQHEPDLLMIVGLGNPGPRYEDTRHNVGFMAIDYLAKQADIRTDRLQANCAVGRGRIFDRKILLAKPMTFMNVSGEGIGKLSKYYGVPPERILVIYDDLDTPTATVRLRAKGGHGGHNGMRSLIQHLGGQEFPRCKIGISRPPEGLSVATYVLQDFSKSERELIDEAVVVAVEAAKAFVVLGIDKAVSGTRIDSSGNPVAPKGNHQNGKGVKQPKGPKKPAAAAAAAVVVGDDTAAAAVAPKQQHAKEIQAQQENGQQQPQSALGAAIAAAAAAANADK